MSILAQCMNQDGHPRAVEIDPDSRFYGWVFYKHPDGQWVTLREANTAEMELFAKRYLTKAQPSDNACHATETLCPTCNNDFRKCTVGKKP